MNRFDAKAFAAIAWPPESDRADWLLNAEASVEFLHANARSDEIVIYASAETASIQGVLAPTAKVSPADQDDLLHARIMQEDSWRIERIWGGDEGHRIELAAPLSSTGSLSLVGGEKLVYRRAFTGVDEVRTPVELSQKLVHSLELNWVEERSAFCRLDNRGDLEDVIRVIWMKRTNAPWPEVVVTIRAKDLRNYMAAADMSLVLDFDFTRIDFKSFGGWHAAGQDSNMKAPDLFYTLGNSGNASFINGAMIIRPAATLADLVEEWKAEERQDKRQYATFKIHDWRNERNVEISCAPESLSNYFTKSDKPFELSPAFFRPDVLVRFKNDPEKYDLTDRTIGCRNAWYLKTYDINEQGQVHTYIGYLQNLPYEEQLYWKAFNEWPKGPISKRAYENDFEGKFSSEYDPLRELKHKIRQLDEAPPAWWKARGDAISDATRYPATDSVSEWGDEILALDQLVVEGFLQKPLQELATNAGRTVEPPWQSLRLLQDYLEAQGRDAEDAKAVVAPLVTLHRLRTILKGHAAPSERTAQAKKARSEHGTLRAHFTALAAQCDAAFTAVLKELGADQGVS